MERGDEREGEEKETKERERPEEGESTRGGGPRRMKREGDTVTG